MSHVQVAGGSLAGNDHSLISSTVGRVDVGSSSSTAGAGGSCHADFVNPVSWHELSETHWWMRLRCGECGFVREVEVTNEEAQSFEHELDRGVEQIAAAFVRLDRERMIADSEAIVAALERDLIDPGDFFR